MERFKPLWVKEYVENEILVFVKRGEEISANLAFDGAWGAAVGTVRFTTVTKRSLKTRKDF